MGIEAPGMNLTVANLASECNFQQFSNIILSEQFLTFCFEIVAAQ